MAMHHYQQEHTVKNAEIFCTVEHFPPNQLGHWLSALVQSSLDSVIVVDNAHQIVLANYQGGRVFGYPAQQMLARPLDLLLPSRLLGAHHAALLRLADARVGKRRLRMRFDSTGLRSSGEEFMFEATISRVTIRGNIFFPIVLREWQTHESQNRSSRHQKAPSARSEFQRRAAASQQVHEVEKKRVSRLLYDDLGQSLSVLKLDMDWMQNTLIAETSATLPRVDQMQSALDHIISRIKSIASTLRPPLLDDFGLIAALQWVSNDFQKKTGISCTLTSQSTGGRAGDAIESAIFRLVQESLLNIEHHAKANTVTIFLWRKVKSLDVLIQDDGIGMTSGSENKPGCYGLIGMQERIYTLGGAISISNVETRGLAIHASIPVEFVSEPFHPLLFHHDPPCHCRRPHHHARRLKAHSRWRR